MALHASWCCTNWPFSREYSNLQNNRWRIVRVLNEEKTVPCKLGSSEITGPGLDMVGEGGTTYGCGRGVEEKKGWNGEENYEE
jgi:hypothetical protein